MDESIGRDTEPATNGGEPDAPESDARMRDAEIRGRVRDVPPPVRYDDTAFTDPDEKLRTLDPLDPHKPSRANGDPLDPGRHVI